MRPTKYFNIIREYQLLQENMTIKYEKKQEKTR